MRSRVRAFQRLLTCSFALWVARAQARSADGEAAHWLEDYFKHWGSRVEAARSSQPDWINPLATSGPRLGQEFRFDYHHQTLANGDTLDIAGGGKGLSLIPARNTQVTVALPAYQSRQGQAPAHGFSDWSGMLLKYRLLSANEKSGNYVLSLVTQYGFPTGIRVFSNRNRVVTTSLAAGKGFGPFSVQSTLGVAMPTRDHSRAGRAILSNVAFQYRVSRHVWPDVEVNRTDWSGGTRNGRSQTLLTTGLLFGRYPLGSDYRVSVGMGYQVAVSRTYAQPPATPAFNHNWIASVRTAF